MPVQLVGKKVTFTGKPLWNILGNLKNFGVGRIVVKSHFKNYPEPSYYRIVRVQPVEAPTEMYFDRRVMVWAEHVFRGKKYSEPVRMHDRTFKAKFQLIPRSEESKYIESEVSKIPNEIAPFHEWPPLLKIYLERGKGTKLEPLRVLITEAKNQHAVLSKSEGFLKSKPPTLYMENSVAELTKQLAELKSRAEAEVTADKTS